MFIAPNDQTCTPASALEQSERIESPIEYIVLDDDQAGHEYFAFEARDDWFMENLIDEMQIESLTSAEVYFNVALTTVSTTISGLFTSDIASLDYKLSTAAIFAVYVSLSF